MREYVKGQRRAWWLWVALTVYERVASRGAKVARQTVGIDLTTTLPDHTGRPVHLLDDCEPSKELL